MNKDFKEAMQAKVIEIYGKPPEPIKSQNVFDENYHRYCDSVMDFEVGWNACYTYLQKEGGKDLVTGVRQDSSDIGDAPVDSSNSVEQEGGYYYELFKFFSDEHNLTLLDTEIQDIIHAVKAFEIIKTTFTKNEKD